MPGLALFMPRFFLQVVAEVTTILCDPIEKAAAFAEVDWRGLVSILKREFNPNGTISSIGAVIGEPRDTLPKRVARGVVTVHDRGQSPVTPSNVSRRAFPTTFCRTSWSNAYIITADADRRARRRREARSAPSEGHRAARDEARAAPREHRRAPGRAHGDAADDGHQP